MPKKKQKQTRTQEKNEYARLNYVHYHIKVRKTDTEVLEKLNSVPSKNGYITDLIRQDIQKEKASED